MAGLAEIIVGSHKIRKTTGDIKSEVKVMQKISKTFKNLSLAFGLAAAPLAANASGGLSLICTKGDETISVIGGLEVRYNPALNRTEQYLGLFLNEDNYLSLFAEHIELQGTSAARPRFEEGVFTMGERPVGVWVLHNKQHGLFNVIFQYEAFLSLFSQMEIETTQNYNTLTTQDYLGLTANGWVCDSSRWFSPD
jgi:hypothetical protein